MGCHALLQGIFPILGSNPCLLHLLNWQAGSLPLSSVHLLRRVQFFATPRTPACQASLFITNSWSLVKLMSIESVMPSNHLILCRPLLLLPSIFPSIRVFSSELALHIRWPKGYLVFLNSTWGPGNGGTWMDIWLCCYFFFKAVKDNVLHLVAS